MNWIILIIAGLCEGGFTFCIGKSKDAVGMEYFVWLGGFLAFTFFSMLLLMKVAQHLPIGTAYPVWTGIRAVGTVLIGIFYFHEPVTFSRLFFIICLILSIIGLKIVS